MLLRIYILQVFKNLHILLYLCKFRKEWLTKYEYKKWIQERAGDKKAYCKVCTKSVDLSNMGQRALISHMQSKKHSDSVAVQSGTSALQCIEACFSTSSTSKAVNSSSITDRHVAQKTMMMEEV